MHSMAIAPLQKACDKNVDFQLQIYVFPHFYEQALRR